MSELKILLVNTHQRIGAVIEDIDNRTAEEASGFAYVKLAYYYRTLGVCHLLLHADADSFFKYLCKSSQTYLYLLKRVEQGQSCKPVHLCASRAFPFMDGLVAGDLQSARKIAERLPGQHDPLIEYEDDFLFYHCVRLILQGGAESQVRLEEGLTRWRAVLEGGEDPYLEACQALSTSEADAFARSLEQLVTERRREFAQGRQDRSIDPETQLTEGRIFLKGLALLRLAGLRSLEVPSGLPLMPDIARFPLGRVPPPSDQWNRP